MLLRRSVVALVAMGCALGIPVAGAEDQGVIKGAVSWTASKTPRRKVFQIGADPQCVRMRGNDPLLSERIVVNANGTVKNVFVYVKSGLPAGREWPVPEEVMVVDQKGCRYEPHVFGILAGQTVRILNSDATLHNVNCNPKQNAGFNKAQPRQGLKYEHVFNNPEIMIKLKCDSHTWMSAYCGVLDHPFFAVTDDQGAFEIKGLPAGEYIVATWHEDKRLKPLEKKVVVGEGDTKDVEFAYPIDKKQGGKK